LKHVRKVACHELNDEVQLTSFNLIKQRFN